MSTREDAAANSNDTPPVLPAADGLHPDEVNVDHLLSRADIKQAIAALKASARDVKPQSEYPFYDDLFFLRYGARTASHAFAACWLDAMVPASILSNGNQRGAVPPSCGWLAAAVVCLCRY
jgi:hypothetical protein